MSLGKRDRSERSRRLVFPVCSLSAAFPGPAAAFEPPGKECGGAHVALADCCFLPLRLEFMSGCFLLCCEMPSPVPLLSDELAHLAEAYLKSPNHMTHPVISHYLVV